MISPTLLPSTPTDRPRNTLPFARPSKAGSELVIESRIYLQSVYGENTKRTAALMFAIMRYQAHPAY